jgi:uncharacterized protein (TIGR03083 family)
VAARDLWATVHAERRALATDLAALGEPQWSTTSWCKDWTVHDVVAHMTATASMSPPSFLVKLAGSGFSFSKLQAKDIARERGSSSAETLARFQAKVDSTSHPPGPPTTWLGETLVHAEDVRRPLGIAHAYPPEAAVEVASFYSGSNLLIGSKRRIAGLRLHATDADWTHGDGPSVEGPIIALVLSMTGRTGANAELKGDGVATLARRT